MTERACCNICWFNGGPYWLPDQSVTDGPKIKCRRRAPVATGGMMSNMATIWPSVAPWDWCGEFERDGND